MALVGAFRKARARFRATGYFPFIKGAAAYRFFTQDAISFEKSLRVAIGFGVNEEPLFRKEFSKPGSTLQLSSTFYWYQSEPHAPLPAMPQPRTARPPRNNLSGPTRKPCPRSTN